MIAFTEVNLIERDRESVHRSELLIAFTEVNLIERDRGERPQSGHSGEEIGESVHKMNILEREIL